PRAAVAGGAWLPRRNFGQERRRQWQCARGARLALKRKHRRGIVGTAFGRGGETGEQGGGQADIARDGKRRDFGGKGLHAKQPRVARSSMKSNPTMPERLRVRTTKAAISSIVGWRMIFATMAGPAPSSGSTLTPASTLPSRHATERFAGTLSIYCWS